MTRQIYEYGSFEFEITKQFKFKPLETSREYGSYLEMAEALDRLTVAKKKAARRPIAIPCLDAKGNQHTITGIHAGHGNPIAKPPVEAGADLYPDVQWVKDAMREHKAAEDRSNQMFCLLKAFSLRPEDNWRYRFDESKFEEVLDALEKHATETIERAQNIPDLATACGTVEKKKRIRL